MTNKIFAKTASVGIKRFSENVFTDTYDLLVVEEPLEISVCLQSSTGRLKKNIGITMRTPGHDVELVTGYLFSAGIIKSTKDIHSIAHASSVCDKIEVELNENINHDFETLSRFGVMNAACGICGVTSWDALTDAVAVRKTRAPLLLKEQMILEIPVRVSTHQQLFEKTGGIHAAALFNMNGELMLIREDVGRHNALDKVIGYAFSEPDEKPEPHILFLSGRAGFELIQKAGMANIPVIVCVGAPSSLAVEMARDFQITLIGFLRNNRFNLYSDFDKWITDENQNKR